jgi:hypothetical protein
MKAFRYDPYLWIHLAGLAAVPIWLDGCLMGLAVGYPSMPRLELAALIGVGVIPALLMQLQRPFCIFCLIVLALRPTALTDGQRKILTLFRRWRVRWVSLLVPVPLVWVLLKLYDLAPVAADITPFSGWGRVGGVALASICFLMANIFLQVPASVLQVLLMPEKQFAAAGLYPTERVRQDFTLIGLPVNRILPDIVSVSSPQGNMAGAPEATITENSVTETNDSFSVTTAEHQPVESTEPETLTADEELPASLADAGVEDQEIIDELESFVAESVPVAEPETAVAPEILENHSLDSQGLPSAGSLPDELRHDDSSSRPAAVASEPPGDTHPVAETEASEEPSEVLVEPSGEVHGVAEPEALEERSSESLPVGGEPDQTDDGEFEASSEFIEEKADPADVTSDVSQVD